MSNRKLRNVRFSLINILKAITNKKILERIVTIRLSNSRHQTPKYSLSSAITDTHAKGLNKYKNITSAWNIATENKNAINANAKTANNIRRAAPWK